MFQEKRWTLSFIAIALVASAVALVEYRRINVLSDRLGCAAYWLEKAKSLHQTQMNNPGNFTGDTMRNLMDSVDWAYTCTTKDPSSGHPGGSGAFGEHGDILQHQGDTVRPAPRN